MTTLQFIAIMTILVLQCITLICMIVDWRKSSKEINEIIGEMVDKYEDIIHRS